MVGAGKLKAACATGGRPLPTSGRLRCSLAEMYRWRPFGAFYADSGETS